MNELISIIIPVYNTENYIDKCLDSVVNQTYNNLEIIVVNDGSKDGSEKIIMQYVNKDKRIKYLSKSNGGLSDARNFGLNNMNGDYVTFLDSDDTLDLNFCSKLLELITKYDADVACSERDDCTFENTGVRTLSKSETIHNYLKYDKYFSESACAKLYKASLFNDLRFELGKIHEDTFFCYKLINNINKCVYLSYPGYFVFKREGSITNSKFTNKNYDKVIACREIYDFYKSSEFKYDALNKYVGSLLYFILKTNRDLTISNNKIAIDELRHLKIDNYFKLKPIFIILVILGKMGILKLFKL